MKARLVHIKEAGIVETILAMESIFPQKLGYGRTQVIENLENPNNVNIVAENDNGVIGYILGIPHNDAVTFFKEDDPLMSDNSDGKLIYVDQIAVIMSEQDSEHAVFKFLVKSFAYEVKKKGFDKWSGHLAMGLNFIIGAMYEGRILARRRVKLPCYDNLPFVYMEGWV